MSPFPAMVAAYTLGKVNHTFIKPSVSLLPLMHHHADLMERVAILFTILFPMFTAAASRLAGRNPWRRKTIISNVCSLPF